MPNRDEESGKYFYRYVWEPKKPLMKTELSDAELRAYDELLAGVRPEEAETASE